MAWGTSPFGITPFGGLRDNFHVKLELPKTGRIETAKFMDTALIERLHNDADALRNMDRRGFERLVAEVFDGLGYDVELTKQTRDGGKDIIAVKKREVDLRLLIECKRPDVGNPVSVAFVRELLGVKVSERATKGILATTSYFTEDARELFDKHQWELEPRDFDGIKEWLEMYLRIKKGG